MFFLYELFMSFWSSRKQLPSIVYHAVSYGSLFDIDDQLSYDYFFRIPEVVAYESFGCIVLGDTTAQQTRQNYN